MIEQTGLARAPRLVFGGQRGCELALARFLLAAAPFFFCRAPGRGFGFTPCLLFRLAPRLLFGFAARRFFGFASRGLLGRALFGETLLFDLLQPNALGFGGGFGLALDPFLLGSLLGQTLLVAALGLRFGLTPRLFGLSLDAQPIGLDPFGLEPRFFLESR
ncbi:MAG: hypothetical protein R3305_04730, partial [Gammaproteobacteria bacterium]|nr:hypothetical protein [Gammaproteobacteria bacterium]